MSQIVEWLFDFKGNDVQLLFWSAVVSVSLVFLIERLRKPKIKCISIGDGIDFDLPFPNNIHETISKNYKIRLNYDYSIFNKLLFKYSINNLKVRFEICDIDLRKIKEFQAKPDSNPNVYGEVNIPAALAGINLNKNENDKFPFINRNDKKWLLFDVWAIFLNQKRDEFIIENGEYYLKVKVNSNQVQKVFNFKFRINENLEFVKLDIIEKLKLRVDSFRNN